MIQARPYQLECVQAVVDKYKAGVRAQLISLPTGSGKTVVTALIARKFRCRTLFLVHREELADQTVAKFADVWPEASVGIVMGERNEVGRDITVASVQTLMSERRRAQVLRGFGLVFVDEAHHYVSRAWEKVVRSYYSGQNLLVGVTATARRADRVALGSLFQEIVYHKGMLDLIAEDYLVDMLGVEVRTQLSLDGIGASSADFDDDELASVVNVDNRNTLIAEAYLQHGKGRKAICFAANVRHAHDLARAMGALGIRAAAVDGTMAMSERRHVLKAFSQGNLDVLCNCMVLSEGYDETSIGCVILARPTKSPSLYTQMVGRGARLHPGKEDCLVIDVTDNTVQHDLVTLPTLFGIPRPEISKAGGVAKAAVAIEERERDRNPASRQGSGIVVRPVSLFSRSQFAWTPSKGGQWLLNLGDQGKVILRPAEEGGYHVLHRQHRQEQILHPRPTTIDWAMGIAEERVRGMLGKRTELIDRSATWRKEPATEKQIELLRRMRAPVWANMTKGDAVRLIDEISAAGGPGAWWRQRRAKKGA